MADTQFKIEIVSDADLKGFQQTSAAANKLKSDTTDLSESTKRSLGTMEPLKDETKKFGEAAEEMGEKVGESRREMREMGSEIGRVFDFTELGAVAVGGMGTAAVGTALAVEMLFKSIENLRESLHGPISFITENEVAKINAASIAWNQYAEARKKANEASDTPDTSAARDIGQLQTELKLLQDILKARETEALSNLAAQKDRMSPEAYGAAEAQIRQRFSDQASNAELQEKRDEIDRRQIEANELTQRAATDRAKGEALGTGNASGQEASKENAAAAAKAMEEIEQHLKLLDRISNPKNPEYEGVGGFFKKISDARMFISTYGGDSTLEDARKLEEIRKAQAESAIALGAKADEQQKRLSQQKNDLLTKAGQESAQADQLNNKLAYDRGEFNAERQNTQTTRAIGEAGTALGQEDAAMGNNTRQGYLDAQAAHLSAAKAIADLSLALRGITDTHSEAYAAIMQALADLRSEDKKLAGRLAQMQFNNK